MTKADQASTVRESSTGQTSSDTKRLIQKPGKVCLGDCVRPW